MTKITPEIETACRRAAAELLSRTNVTKAARETGVTRDALLRLSGTAPIRPGTLIAAAVGLGVLAVTPKL